MIAQVFACRQTHIHAIVAKTKHKRVCSSFYIFKKGEDDGMKSAGTDAQTDRGAALYLYPYAAAASLSNHP